MDALCSLLTIGFLLVLGFTAGSWAESRHFRQLQRRQRALADMIVTDLPSFPYCRPGPPPQLIVGEVVIATDYFKSFAAALRKVVGGRVGSYEKMIRRARWEATLRVLEQARALGYNAVCNLRVEPADVGGNTSQGRMPMAAVLAFGTAYVAQLGENPAQGTQTLAHQHQVPVRNV